MLKMYMYAFQVLLQYTGTLISDLSLVSSMLCESSCFCRCTELGPVIGWFIMHTAHVLTLNPQDIKVHNNN